ncbi:MAG: PEGA domain-containing protein [bacterium]
MRNTANILLTLGLSLAVLFCAVIAIQWGLDARNTPASVSTSDTEAFSPYAAKNSTPIVEVARDDEDKTLETEVGQTTTSAKKPRKLKPAVLQVVTNFEKADVTINGIPYPEYTDPGQPDGIVLPAGGPYDVRVTYSGKVKAYNLYLKPNETRMLFVELTGFQGGAAPPPPKAAPQPAANKEPETKTEEGKEPGKVTVYAKPQGLIVVDGAKTAEKTPGTVEVANGRHEIQVEYEGGEMSEKKIVRVRDGSKIKIFFRQRTDTAE